MESGERLYTNDIQRLYKVTSSIVNVRQQDMDLSTYIGQIASLKEEFLTMMPLTPDVGAQQTQLDKFFMVLTLPKSTHETLSHPGWRQAMVDEMAALHSNGTWDLCSRVWHASQYNRPFSFLSS